VADEHDEGEGFSPEDEEFLRRISEQLGEGRALEIFRELFHGFAKFMVEQSGPRIVAHIEQLRRDPSYANAPPHLRDAWEFTSASTRAGAEAVLAAVAGYLASQETPPTES
jgi:hypothetical protein